jgi:[ribosomal protein S5]-alanine N-acetyltransferase
MVSGQRVSLRPVTIDDCTMRYVEWLRDPEVNRYLESRWIDQTLDSVRAFVEAAGKDGSSHLLAIIDNATVMHIGNIKIGPVIARHQCADISYFIGERTFWGRGYATEAIRLASRFGFEQLDLHRLQAGLYAGNVGSARALEKAGYAREAVFERQLAGPDGWEDHVWYRMLREEWTPD